jgi:hypothetical protein
MLYVHKFILPLRIYIYLAIIQNHSTSNRKRLAGINSFYILRMLAFFAHFFRVRLSHSKHTCRNYLLTHLYRICNENVNLNDN